MALSMLAASVAMAVAPAAPASAASACAADQVLGTSGVVRAIGVPGVGPGTVDVRPGNGLPAQRLSGVAGTGFGSAVAAADVDQDGCLDLLVGAPRTGGKGSVEILLGGPAGFATRPVATLTGRSSGERFGSRLVARARAAGGVDVWVAAPRRTVGGKTRAGAVDHFVVAPDGTSRRVETLTAARASGGSVQKSAEFGTVLTASAEGVAVGAPRQDVSGRADAGAAYWFPLTASSGLAGKGTAWTQASRGVPGSPEKGDHFGSALSISTEGSPRWVLVGIPDEDLGTKKDAGSVQSFSLAAGGRSWAPRVAIDETQARAGGRTTTGNHFGAAVAVADGTCLTGGWVVGSPGTDVGTTRDAGAFSLVAPPGTTCTSIRFTQRALAQHDETGDRFGATLSTLGRARRDAQQKVSQLVLVGAPGEDAADGTDDAGSVTSFWRSEQKDEHGRPVLTPVLQYFSCSGGNRTDARYGAVLPDVDPSAAR